MNLGRRIESLSYRQLLALVVLAGAALRLGFLARQPLGFDEDVTAAAARLPLADMLRVVSRDSGPPLHYLLVWGLDRILPDPIGLRLVSAVAGVATIALAAALGRRLGGDRAGIGAALLVAFLPAAVVASQTGRPYALATALSAGAALAFWRAIETPSPVRWLLYFACAAAALWTSYFTVFALAGCGVAALVLRAPVRALAAAAVVTAAAALSLLPWLSFAAAQFDHAGEPFWVQPLGPAMLAGTAGQLFAGPEAAPYLPLRTPLFAAQVVAVAAGLVAFAGLARLAGRGVLGSGVPNGAVGSNVLGRTVTASGEPASAGRRRAVVFCAIAGTAAILLMAAISLFRPLLEARYASVAAIPLFALGGLGLALLPRRVATVVLACLIVPSVALSAATTQRETELLVPAIEARLSPHDLVVAEPDEFVVLLAEGSAELRLRLHVLTASPTPWYFGTAVYPPNTEIHGLPDDVRAGGGHVLYVAAPGQQPAVPLPGFSPASTTCVTGACLTDFAPTTAGDGAQTDRA